MGDADRTAAAALRVVEDTVWFHPDAVGADGIEAAGAGTLEAIAGGAPAASVLAEFFGLLADPASALVPDDGLPADRTVAPAEGDDIDGTALAYVDGVTVFDGPRAATIESTHDLQPLIQRTFADLDSTRPLVLDLRGCGPHATKAVHAALERLHGGPVPLPGVRAVTYPGFVDEVGWIVERGGGAPDPTMRAERPWTIVVDSTCAGLALAQALQRSVGAGVVQSGHVAPSPRPPVRHPIPGSGLAAVVRTTDCADDTTVLPWRPTAVVPDGDDPLPVAAGLVSGARGGATAQPEKPGRSASAPRDANDGRWLAALRLDGTIRHRFAYHHLLDEPWSQTSDGLVADLVNARTGADVDIALARAAKSLHDGHAIVRCSTADGVLGGAFRPPIRLVRLDEDFVVTQTFGLTDGPCPGDRVMAVDGVGVKERLAAMLPWLPASTPHGLGWRFASMLLAGREGTEARIDVVSADDEHREFTVPRTFAGPVSPEASLPVACVTSSGVGYLDAGRVAPREVAAAFAMIEQTPACVFDLRRYPRSAGMLIASRTTQRTVVGALIRRPVPTAPYDDSTPWWHPTRHQAFMEQLVHPAGDPYQGRVVVLIDEGTISQGEHVSLMLEATCDPIFVGSPSNGTNGNVAYVDLGRGRSALYTGIDVRHGDGSQLQRVGVQVHVGVRPTASGLAAGLDEVLERGLQTALDAAR